MIFLALPIGTLAFDPLSLPMNYPGIGMHVMEYGLSRALSSYFSRIFRRQSLSRREMRKMANRRRRWFVDNIIMHHQRLHNLQRQQKTKQNIDSFLDNVLQKKSSENSPSRNSPNKSHDDWGRNRWRGGSENYENNSEDIKNRSMILREKMQASRARQASWMRVLLESKRPSPINKLSKDSGWN